MWPRPRNPWTRHPAHLAHGTIWLRNERQHQQREGMVERRIGEWQGTRVGDLEGKARVVIGARLESIYTEDRSTPRTLLIEGIWARPALRLPVPYPTSSTRSARSIPTKSMNSGVRRRLQRPICNSY